MNRAFLLLLFIFWMHGLYSQSSSSEILSTAGETFQSTSMQIDWTLGELAIETIHHSNRQITQGFHQPNYIAPLLTLSPIVFLQGAYDCNRGLMRDDLRTISEMPFTEPYTELGFTHIGGGGEITQQAVFDIAGTNAIVDWVFLELRDKTDITSVAATRSALLKRDGVVVDIDGISPVVFNGVPQISSTLAKSDGPCRHESQVVIK